MTTRASKFRSDFGKALDEQLAKKGKLQSDLARATNTDPAYINRLMQAGSKVSPEWTEIICNSLQVSGEDRVKLHRAAASTWGYKLDLTKD